MPETNLDDLFTSDDRILYTEIAFAQHVNGTLKWHEGKTFAMARIERTIKRMTFVIVVKRDEPRTPNLLPAIRVYSHDEVLAMSERMSLGPPEEYSEFTELLFKIVPHKFPKGCHQWEKSSPGSPYCSKCGYSISDDIHSPV